MIKKGDTLIEVTLAVGIFSMIAIAIVAVMSGGTVGAQTALETTLTREEIDAQAEALRFIHTSYIADKDSGNKNLAYVKLWKAITSKAIDFEENKGIDEDAIVKFTPRKDTGGCPRLYTDNNQPDLNKRLIINPRALGDLPSGEASDSAINTVLVPYNSKFQQAQTYPHLIYGSYKSDANLVEANNVSSSLYSVEGIYIVAVKDDKTTKLSEGRDATTTSAFYDFYIRTCWYGANADEPSTISTVIRLYDPDAIKIPKSTEPTQPEYHVNKANDTIATIKGINGGYSRTFTKTNDGGAYVGYACNTYPSETLPKYNSYRDKSYVGPVLVSKDSNRAVGYKTDQGSRTYSGSINYYGTTYYYSSWEDWMQIDSCTNAKNSLANAKGKSNEVYTWNERLTSEDAVKSAAKRLLDDVSK